MRVKEIKLSVSQARDHLNKLTAQNVIFERELQEVDPQLESLQEKIIDAVIMGDSKANDYRREINDLQARKTDLTMALTRLGNLITQAQMDLADAQKSEMGGRYTELAKEINQAGNEAVKALKVALEYFDRHEIASEGLTTLSSEMKRRGVPLPGIEESLISFRRANEKLDEALTEIAAGTLDYKAGISILDKYGIPGRIGRINSRKEEISKFSIGARNGEVGK
ncbi:MAG: hypothetical protein ACYC3H_05210 [Bellilinea sp.]